MTTHREEAVENKALNIKPFNLVSSAQREVMVTFMKEVSGLKREQFAVNSWGFPIIPIPQVRRSRERVRLAPQNVSEQFLFHPIYWIDPTLTEYDPNKETEEQWSIRMFYLILGFGYWTDQLQWIDYIQANLKSLPNDGYWDRGDVEGYHAQSNPWTRFDHIGLMGEEHLVVPLEEVHESYNLAAARCNDILEDQMSQMLYRQSQALASGKAILGQERLNDPDLAPDTPGGYWSTKLEPPILHLCELYDAQFDLEYPQLGQLTGKVNEAFNQVLQAILGIDAMIATLTIPVIRYAETMSDAYSHLTTYLAMANSQARERERGYPIMEIVGGAMSDNRARGALTEVLRYTYEVYFTAWRRMRLAIFNYERMQEGLHPFENYTQLEAFLIEAQSEFRSKDREQREQTFKNIDELFQ